MQKVINLIIISTILFIIGVFFISLTKNPGYNTKDLVGKVLTEISLKSFDENKTLTNNDLKKKDYTLINFWASWCAPCRMENKFLLSIKQKYDLKILGINFKDKKSYAKDFLKEFGNPYYKIASDQDGRTSVIFGIFGIPESILIDQNLFVIKKFVGPLNEQDLTEIENIIKK